MAKTKRPPQTEQAESEKRANFALDRKPSGTIDLVFQPVPELAHAGDPIWEDVSSLAVIGRSIFCTCDETSSVERVVYDKQTGRAEAHRTFALGAHFDLPGGIGGEMDIEGLAICDGYLWVCGSHSLKRDDPEDDLDGLHDVDWDPNRAFLGKVPLIDRGDGIFDLAGAIEPLDGAPARHGRMVEMATKKSKSPIRTMLSKDELVGPFVDLPCKENGLDIEGLAVRGDTVLLGLRGPVLAGYAIIVRMEMKTTKNGFLKPAKLDGGKRYALQAIDLHGHAIRDLHWQNDRLLILTGATTDLEALQSVVTIEDYDPERTVYPSFLIRRVLDLPAIRGSDHAEGLAPIVIDDAEKLLIAYDSPSEGRTDADDRRLTADLFDIGPGTSVSGRDRVGPAGAKGRKTAKKSATKTPSGKTSKSDKNAGRSDSAAKG